MTGKLKPPISLPDVASAIVRWLIGMNDARCSLYIRPTIIGTQPTLGLQKPKQAMLFIVMGYYMSHVDMLLGGMRLQTSPEDMVRSWEGGFGYAKVGANYGLSVLATQDASTQGFHQILWLY